jgi:hypothetical protein
MLPKICEIFPVVSFEHFLQGSSSKSFNGWMYGWMVHFWCHNGHFCKVHYVKFFVVNIIILNLLIKNWQYINMIIMSKFVKLYLKIMHSLSTMNFWSLKIWTNRLVGLLIYWIHIKFHSKLFMVIKYALKFEIIKLDMNFSLKP